MRLSQEFCYLGDMLFAAGGFELAAVIQDLFHVYLNKCEFQFLRLHINKTNTFCFLIDNGLVTGTTK